MERILITTTGFGRMKEELRQLKSVELPRVITAIGEARERGDVSKNAEYHAACERKGFIDTRVTELEDKISRAEVIDPTKLSGPEIQFGATVTLVDAETEEEVTYKIVGHDESDIKQGLISIFSPLARALLAKSEGDTVSTQTPRGSKSYEVIRVVFK